jgi:hypothetical protein
VTPIARHRNGRTPLEGCDGWRVPRRTRVYRPRNNITQEPVSEPPAAHCQATLPSISHDQRHPTTSGELSASTEARGWGMNADEGSMITRFPAPWRIVELPNGFAVEDATGKQIGVFYGRAPCSAGHTGIMTMDEARQMVIDFAKLPELLKRNGNAE